MGTFPFRISSRFPVVSIRAELLNSINLHTSCEEISKELADARGNKFFPDGPLPPFFSILHRKASLHPDLFFTFKVGSSSLCSHAQTLNLSEMELMILTYLLFLTLIRLPSRQLGRSER